MIESFLLDIDRGWKTLGDEPIRLSVFGSAALFLQTDYERGTKDADILEVDEISKHISEPLLELSGKESALHKKHRIYLEIVKRPVPFLPPKPIFLALDSLQLENFRIQVMDVVDVVVSKLKPFRPQDQDDIREMVKRGRVDPQLLLERFLLAKERWLTDARAPELKNYIANLHKVQREMLSVPETPIELPDWLDNQ